MCDSLTQTIYIYGALTRYVCYNGCTDFTLGCRLQEMYATTFLLK
jgi:hypothetical protein